MKVLLELVKEEIYNNLNEASGSTILTFLGVWLGVLEDGAVWKEPDGLRQYQHVAESAIVCAVQENSVAKDYFFSGIKWLRCRRFFVASQSSGLEADPLAIVALAIGISKFEDELDAGSWLYDLAEKAMSRERCEHRVSLLSLASVLVDGTSDSWVNVSSLIKVAVARKVGRPISQDESRQALTEIITEKRHDPELAPFYAAAFRTIFALEASIDIAQPTIAQVRQLLSGIPAALKRWPWEDRAKTKSKNVTRQRWDVQHEYHVQSLVWAVLRPVFPGLEDEENLPSVGHKHPRADLLVPALRLVIEVKFVREATQAARAKVIEEIAADTALYRTKSSGYDRIIAFIWDSTGSIHHHAEIESGVKKLEGIEDVVIVMRPGEWQ